MATRSPSRRLRSLTRSPFTSEPFEELQSRRKYWLPRYSMTAWRRDTMASGSTTSFEGSRPMERSVRASAISRRDGGGRVDDQLGHRRRRQPARKVCLKGPAPSPSRPSSTAGAVLPASRTRRQHRVVDDLWPPDSHDLDVRDLARLGDHERAATETDSPDFSCGASLRVGRRDVPGDLARRRVHLAAAFVDRGRVHGLGRGGGGGVAFDTAAGRASTRARLPGRHASVPDQGS